MRCYETDQGRMEVDGGWARWILKPDGDAAPPITAFRREDVWSFVVRARDSQIIVWNKYGHSTVLYRCEVPHEWLMNAMDEA